MLGEKLNIRNVSLDNFCYFCIAAVASLAVFFILHNANWVIGDDFEWLKTTALGIAEPISYHVGNGRFVPFNHFDSNLTLFLPYGNTAFVHYLLVAIVFCLASFSFLKALKLMCQMRMVCYSWVLTLFLFMNL